MLCSFGTNEKKLYTFTTYEDDNRLEIVLIPSISTKSSMFSCIIYPNLKPSSLECTKKQFMQILSNILLKSNDTSVNENKTSFEIQFDVENSNLVIYEHTSLNNDIIRLKFCTLKCELVVTDSAKYIKNIENVLNFSIHLFNVKAQTIKKKISQNQKLYDLIKKQKEMIEMQNKMKESMETTLFSKFIKLINTKKEKIIELQNKVNFLEKKLTSSDKPIDYVKDEGSELNKTSKNNTKKVKDTTTLPKKRKLVTRARIQMANEEISNNNSNKIITHSEKIKTSDDANAFNVNRIDNNNSTNFTNMIINRNSPKYQNDKKLFDETGDSTDDELKYML